MRELTGIQILPLNTVYQLHADAIAGLPEGQQWLNLPEYMLSHWGGARVAEYDQRDSYAVGGVIQEAVVSRDFRCLHLDLASAPKLVPPGTDIGKLSGPLRSWQPLPIRR